MKKFVSVELSREGFLTWIGGNNERAPDGALQLGSPHVKGAVTLLWSEPEGRDQIQPLIAVPTEELRDFLSFVGTYVTTFRPFTAFFRVVPAEMVSAITERQQPSLRTRSQVVRLVAGASMAEASLRAGRVSSAKSTRLSTLAATMSACFGQAVVAGYSAKSIDWLSREWDAIHRRSRDSEDSLLEVASIWKLISDAVRGISINPVVPFARSYQVISGFIADAVEEWGSKERRSSFIVCKSLIIYRSS